MPPEAQIALGGREAKAIHVVATSDVSVYGLNRILYTTDAYLGLPVGALGTDYVVLGYGTGQGAEASIVATANDTHVRISPTDRPEGRPDALPFDVTLDLGDVFELKVGNDLTGTIITADKKISVFGGNQCANVPEGVGFCDHIVEQLPPTTAWGRRFVTAPLATRVNGDTFRILAAHDGTTVTLNGVAIGSIDRGEFIERIIDGAATIDADKPVLIAQYSNGTDFDGVTSDPFMMLVPPFEQFLASYVVTTPATGFETNFINVVAPTAAIGGITLDGLPIPVQFVQPGRYVELLRRTAPRRVGCARAEGFAAVRRLRVRLRPVRLVRVSRRPRGRIDRVRRPSPAHAIVGDGGVGHQRVRVGERPRYRQPDASGSARRLRGVGPEPGLELRGERRQR